jgi:hypothetical protein
MDMDQVMSTQARPTLYLEDLALGLSLERVRVVRAPWRPVHAAA